jgi:hypothetical protein
VLVANFSYLAANFLSGARQRTVAVGHSAMWHVSRRATQHLQKQIRKRYHGGSVDCIDELRLQQSQVKYVLQGYPRCVLMLLRVVTAE